MKRSYRDMYLAYRDALRKIEALWPEGQKEPEAETYDDTESAYNNGHDVASFEASAIAKAELKGLA